MQLRDIILAYWLGNAGSHVVLLEVLHEAANLRGFPHHGLHELLQGVGGLSGDERIQGHRQELT